MIPCIKYNYSLDLKLQNLDNYQACILFNDNLTSMTIQVYKPIIYKKITQKENEFSGLQHTGKGPNDKGNGGGKEGADNTNIISKINMIKD